MFIDPFKKVLLGDNFGSFHKNILMQSGTPCYNRSDKGRVLFETGNDAQWRQKDRCLGVFACFKQALIHRGKHAVTLIYKRATLDDIDLLTKTRIEVLRAANQLSDDIDMSEVERESYNYYQKALYDGSHIAYLVFDGNRFAGAGGVSFFQVMPTYHNPSGNKAYIMNMYTHPTYRRKGIAAKTLDMLVNDIKNKGITAISLESTDMGRHLYEKYGFIKMNNEMELPK